MKLPKPISNLIDSFERLPGIGPKTAQRLTFFLLHFPQEELERFADSLVELKKGTKLCNVCKNVTEFDVCSVCDDSSRNKKLIAVVANPLDAFALEKTNFKGVYHVLHGIIDPLNGVGPDDLFIKELIDRISRLVDEPSFDSVNEDKIVEVILATNTSMEGESTAMYVSKLIREKGFDSDRVKLTRIARGLPVGGDIEYADDITLSRALDGRLEV
ncbi:recombination protein RecR [candidate division WWE3 bacterium]|uniref:Recombination protein RecR n=1 Tax=candidate division WWE3 bacterium TaxID=2053526 RepID=A0A7X9E7G6_UNCKA|nr:recombination protein RecR [candidate division WWE3 bacterium]